MVRRALLLILALAGASWADTGFPSTVSVKTTDNATQCVAGQIKVSPGTLTCSGNVATVTTGGGGGGGGSSALSVNYNGVQVTSPTAMINVIGPNLGVSANGSTATITMGSGLSISSMTASAFNATTTSMTVTGSGGLRTTYGVIAGSVTANNIADTQVAYSAANLLTGSSNLTFDGTNMSCGGNINAATYYSVEGNPFIWDGADSFGDSVMIGVGGWNTAVNFPSRSTCVGGGRNGGKGTCEKITNAATRTVAVGNSVLGSLTSGADNTCMGASACQNITTSYRNTCIGSSSCGNLTDNNSNDNVCLGYLCLPNIVSPASANACIGTDCFDLLTTGSNNISMGDTAGGDLTTGNANVCLGGNGGTSHSTNVCTSIVTGSSNTALGAAAEGRLTQSGANTGNTLVGYAAQIGTDNTINNSICIGENCVVTSSYTARLGGQGLNSVLLSVSSAAIDGTFAVGSILNVTTSSATFTGSGGLDVTYGVTIGSMSGAGLSNCGDATHAVSWNSTTNLFGCQNVTGSGGGGGGSSTLAITTGTLTTYANPAISSPTAVAVLLQSQFNQTANGATTYISINVSSITALGPSPDLANLTGTLQASQEPAHTGDVTNSAGSLAMTAAGTQSNITNFSHALTITSSMTINTSSAGSNTTGDLFLSVNHPTPTSSSTGGAINVTMTNSTGTALTIYSNRGADAQGNLFNLRADNQSFAQNAFFVDYRGAAAAFTVKSSATTGGFAFNVIGQSTHTSTFQLSGTESDVGTFKITHTSPTIQAGQSDINAAGISISLAGAGTQAQGLFIDSSVGTTGKILNLRNSGSTLMTLGPDGALALTYGITASSAVLGSNGASVTISSNAVLPGTTFYQNGSVTMTSLTVSTLTLNGQLILTPLTVTGNYVFASTQAVVIANCSSACTQTLPAASVTTGEIYRVKSVGTGAVSITSVSGNIDGSATITPNPNQYADIEVISDGSSYWIL